MSHTNGWSALFASAFRQSRNAMVLLDDRRRIVDANAAMVVLLGHPHRALTGRPIAELVVGGPLVTEAEWQEWLAAGRFEGEVTMLHADGRGVTVQWGATTEVATGRRLVLVVALHTSRWGPRFRRAPDSRDGPRVLSAREREVVRLVAQGQTGPEIADELGIAHDTVRTHVRNAMDKLGARSRAHLVAKAYGEELLVA
ncbi:helix-turn-helix transcriptional regulator [Solirubrobacter soli]|uniref:helix-turn-helix transcriptional regulator n=1 Tax=Solirubrobacter soli TaxID=363832 RepID=UPI0004228F36|nr:LuxR C-terminal-related transcriptional regulator [Solirubrobacter soli]